MARTLHKQKTIQHEQIIERRPVCRRLKQRTSLDTRFCGNTPIFKTMSSKMSETEIDNQGRKRISVACQRCRKRKIKCEPVASQGDGQACLACQIAKWSRCEYLRVNSGAIYCPPGESANGSWTLAVASPEEPSFSVVPVGHDIGQYAVSHPSQMATSTTRTPYRTGTDSLVRAPLSPYAPVNQMRPYSSSTSSGLTGADIFGQFQDHDQMGIHGNSIPPSTHTTSGSLHSSAWHSGSEETSAPSSEPYPSQDQMMSYHTAIYADPAISQVDDSGVMPHESTNSFSGLPSLVGSVASYNTSNDKARFLPNPAGLQTHMASNQGPSHRSNSSYSTANSQYTAEADNGTWTPGTMFSLSDNAPGSIDSCGPPERLSPPSSLTSQCGTTYTFGPPLDPRITGEDTTTGYTASHLPNPSAEYAIPHGISTRQDTLRPTHGRLPILSASLLSHNCGTDQAEYRPLQRPHESQLLRPVGQRILQPQPRRSSINRSLLGATLEVPGSPLSRTARRVSASSSSRHARKLMGRQK